MRTPDTKTASYPLASSSAVEDSFSQHEHDHDHEYDAATPYRVRQTIAAEQFGYAAPTEQTTYAGGGGHGF